MKVLIIGTGIIGTIYGWALHDAQIDVVHLVRKEKVNNNNSGINMDILDERERHPKYNITTYYPKCVDILSPENDYDLVILPTNSFQTETALKTIAPLTPNAIYLIFAANWEGIEFIERIIPRNRYLMGYPDAGGTIKDNVYWVNLGSEVHVGVIDESQTDNLQKVVALFKKADMRPDIPNNILHWLLVHNAFTIGFWAAFLKHRNVAGFLKDDVLLKKAYVATQECLHLCEKRGINLKDVPEVQTYMIPRWLFIPMLKRLWKHNESMQRFTAHAADSALECQALYHAIIKSAQELGVKMPVMTELGQYLD